MILLRLVIRVFNEVKIARIKLGLFWLKVQNRRLKAEYETLRDDAIRRGKARRVMEIEAARFHGSEV